MSKEKDSQTLADCLRNFSREEQLGESDMWYCSKCKEHRKAKKQIMMWKPPNVLVLHLKRFTQTGLLRRKKIDTLVTFPLKGLDMTPFVVASSPWKRKQNLYDLIAVSNHSGGPSQRQCVIARVARLTVRRSPPRFASCSESGSHTLPIGFLRPWWRALHCMRLEPQH